MSILPAHACTLSPLHGVGSSVLHVILNSCWLWLVPCMRGSALHSPCVLEWLPLSSCSRAACHGHGRREHRTGQRESSEAGAVE